ncbi:hypothetical protein TSAR_005612 [Trichomalopsis sarcophagae]|uniref:Uncharacterized protein n=1 Tax=Trichomalopsis sarcophagae TaxID=543379 RepID=A0A232EGN7_9HYME|nr:hypothetical protein TSAR_005612 [Trichomalopsis sarcophagae]
MVQDSISYNNISKTKEIDKKPPLRIMHRKRISTNPIEATMNKIQSTITSVMQSTINESNAAEIKKKDINILTGKIIKARLNQMSPRTAKKKTKQIMKCLIDSGSKEDSVEI